MEVRGKPPGGGGGGARVCDGGAGAVPGTGGGSLLARLLIGDVGAASSSTYLGDVGSLEDVVTGGAGAVTGGRGGGARVAGGSSPRGVSAGSLAPESSSSDSEPSVAAVGVAGGGRATIRQHCLVACSQACTYSQPALEEGRVDRQGSEEHRRVQH